MILFLSIPINFKKMKAVKKQIAIVGIGIVVLLLFSGCLGNENPCDGQGRFESDVSYCARLCMVGKRDSQFNQDLCYRICEKAEYVSGSKGINKKIKRYECEKCGICNNETNTA